jgi:O-antigen/teichoic acid export membrane protein
MIGAATSVSVTQRFADRWPLSLSLSTSIAIQALNVVTGVLLARTLGPAGRGELAAVMLWPGVLAAIGGLGMGEAITYHAARGTTAMGTLLGSSLAVCATQSAALVAIGAVLLPIAMSQYSGATLHAALLFLAYVPVYLGGIYLVTAINGNGRYGSFNALRLLVIAASAAGLVVLAVLDRLTVWRATIVYLAAHLLVLAAAGVQCRVPRSSLRVDRAVVRQLLGFGVRSHGGNVASMFNERLDQLLISVFLTPVDLGLYVIAVTMTSFTGLIGSSTSLVALPSLARLAPGEERDRAARRLVAVTLLGSATVTIPLLILAPSLIGWFFGDAYRAAAAPARVLLVATVLLATNRVLGALLRAVGRPLHTGVAELLALVVTALGLAALLPSLGLMGCAVTSFLAYLASMAWLAHRASRELGMTARALLLPDRQMLAQFTRGVRHASRRLGMQAR